MMSSENYLLKELMKTVVIVVTLLLAGSILLTLSLFQDTEVMMWNLGELVLVAVYAISGIVVLELAWKCKPGDVLENSPLTKIIKLIILGFSAFLLYMAIIVIVDSGIQEHVNLVFALVVIGVMGNILWVAYNGFEELIIGVKKIKAKCESISEKIFKRGVFCPDCKVNIEPDKKFCGYCGRSISEIKKNQVNSNVCPECNAKNEDNQKFCGECGASLSRD